MDVALRVAYDGTRFRGLARQPEGNTVEDALLAALRHEGYVEGTLRTGSRTDAGVSAAMNVLKCRLDRPHLKGLVPALQGRLPKDVWVTGVAPVASEWNVQHAQDRTYHYLAPRAGEDAARLTGACAAFEGEHDFTAFARMEDRKATRPVTTCRVVEDGVFWRFEVTAPGFLWNQVRRMVDAALCVGQGRADVADIEAALADGAPHGSFGLAPAEGLMLAEVRYDPPLAWATEAGAVAPGRVAPAVQEAEVRRRLAGSLSAWS